jgi:hypothetical protein
VADDEPDFASWQSHVKEVLKLRRHADTPICRHADLRTRAESPEML